MSLMRLPPESVRLRRIAKAHAAGEFSLIDYRQARREVIANFKASQVEDDDTQPRWRSDSEDLSHDTAVATAPARANVGWVMLLLLVLSLAAATQVFAFEVPAVTYRDPNPATSPRTPIEQVALDGAPGLPEVTVQSAQIVADQALAKIQKRNLPAAHGFTSLELEEIGRLLNALGAHQPNVEFGTEDADDLTALMRTQKQRRGVSVVEMEEVAAAVQAHYRAAGYFLAAAFVPAQQIENAVMHISILPGTLGEVTVRGGNPQLAMRFDDLLHQPLTADAVSTRIYALNQAPGILAQASFEPGAAVGETRMQLKVVEQRRWDAAFALDNYGDEETGEQRLSVRGSWMNPFNRGDALEAGMILAVNPTNQTYGFVGYETPVGGRNQARARLASNDFTVSGVDATDGDGLLFDLAVERYLMRDRIRALSFEAGAGLHELHWETASGDLDQRVALVSGALKGRRVWDDLRIEAQARLHGEIGTIGDDTFEGQDDEYWRILADLFAWRPFDLSFLPGRQKASVTLSVQLSDSQLPSSRRLGIGGVGAARAFQRDVFIADSGALLRFDLRTPGPVGELMLFTDFAYGDGRNDIYGNWARLADIGVAWEAGFAGGFVSRLSAALPLMSEGSSGVEDDGLRLFWSLQYER